MIRVDGQAIAGDTGTIIELALTDEDNGSPTDLTGAAVFIAWLDPQMTKIRRAAQIQSPTENGIVQYQFDEGELTAPNMYIWTQLVDSVGETTTSKEPFILKVGDAI